MKIQAIVKKVIKFNPNDSADTCGGYRVWLDFGEVNKVEALTLFDLQGSETLLDVEIKASMPKESI
jgi:hypothetical protein